MSLILKRGSTSRLSGEWNDDDFDVLADSVVVGRIMKAAAVPVGMSRMWTLAFGYHEDRAPTHGYKPTREDAMTAFAKSWRRRSPSLRSRCAAHSITSSARASTASVDPPKGEPASACAAV